MRLLTNDETFSVAGGHINGQDDPLSLNGNSGNPALDACSNISTEGMRNQCYLETARRINCPGGWEEETTTRGVGRNGLTGRTTTVVCRGSSNTDNAGSSSGGSCDAGTGSSGSDGGGSDGGSSDD